MGVKKLLQLLKPATAAQHISSFSNTTIGIDILIFIHKASYRFAEEMRTTGNVQAFLPYIHQLLDLLQYYLITPVCVFDGRSIPKKREAIIRRMEQKRKSYERGLQLTDLDAKDIELINKNQELRMEKELLQQEKNQLQSHMKQINLQDAQSQSQAMRQQTANNYIQIIDQELQYLEQAIPTKQQQQTIKPQYNLVEVQRQKISKSVQQLNQMVEEGLKQAEFINQQTIAKENQDLKQFIPIKDQLQINKTYQQIVTSIHKIEDQTQKIIKSAQQSQMIVQEKQDLKQVISTKDQQQINKLYQNLTEAISKVDEQRQKISKDVQQLNDRVEQGKKCLKRAVFMKQDLILATMNALSYRNVQIFVAPFEGQSQLAKLYQLKKIQYAISEDSDLVIHQVPTIFKLNIFNGFCNFIDLKNLTLKLYKSPELNKFLRMSKYKRAELAVLLGTDYLDNVKGVGIKKAVQLIDTSRNLSEVVRKMELDFNLTQNLPKMYSQQAQQALIALLLGNCYNPDTKILQYCDLRALQLFDLNRYTDQQLNRLTGCAYKYDQEVKDGLKTARQLNPRVITPLARTVEINLDVELLQLTEQEVREVEKLRLSEQKKKGKQMDIRSFCKPKETMENKGKHAQISKRQELEKLKIQAPGPI